MAHAQKPDFVFRWNGRVHLNRLAASVQSTTGSRGVRISGSNVGYIMFRVSVKSTGYTLHSPVSPSLPLPCITVCHHISTGVYPLERRLVKSHKQCGLSGTRTTDSTAVQSLCRLGCTHTDRTMDSYIRSLVRNSKVIRGTWNKYRGADKSLARPGSKQATAIEGSNFHISYL